MSRALNARLGLLLVAVAGVTAATSFAAAPSQANDAPIFRAVPVPKLKYVSGDVITPLSADLPYPSGDPRDLEGIWANIGGVPSRDGTPPPYTQATRDEIKRQLDLENKGTPVVRKGTLCRADGVIGIAGNQFPTQIIQRPDKILFIAEEGRIIWQVFMNGTHPVNFKHNHLGHSVGHWEGNTLVVDTIGLKARAPNIIHGGNSDDFHIVTRFTRASTGDERNGDLLVMERTVEDPAVYQKPYATIGVSRWRPDLEMLEFNCEESTPAFAATGVKVE